MQCHILRQIDALNRQKSATTFLLTSCQTTRTGYTTQLSPADRPHGTCRCKVGHCRIISSILNYFLKPVQHRLVVFIRPAGQLERSPRICGLARLPFGAALR
ncbi:hypothetical protein K440DRAFT_420408 [Wilcoxina mikolae CBS 423.85]|nr:hypothetical protein K440DRAFT_420408 [Wilcoxina mikolae CBS 423.85]